MQDIKQVLEHWDYEKALVCYRKIGGNSFLLSLFEAGPDPYNQNKLQDELERYIQAQQVNPTRGQAKENYLDRGNSISLSTSTASTSDRQDYKGGEDARATAYHNYPLAVQECISRRISKFKRAQLLHSQLEQMAAPERQTACLEILDLMDEVEELWNQVHHYEEKGVLPLGKPEITVEPATAAQLLKRRNTLRTYVSKAKAGTKKQEDIPKWEAEINEIEKLLKDEACQD